jgi:cysteinyl-tRNA synthetase
MSVKLFNTMSRSVKTLRPLYDNQVGLYTCGPTVYDFAQIGNWATYIRWDVLVRTLRASGYSVNWVMNITDVGHLVSDADEGEDKLEKGARREGKTAWEVAEFYTQDFIEGMEALDIEPPTHLVKATDHIKEQIELVKRLEAKGFTYVIDDGVYFDTSKLSDYGKLARLDIHGLQAGARVEYNQQKRHITDFALWKFSPPGVKRDMEWDSPWGKGFPGWHIECSAMAMKYVGDTVDIHAGGIDFIPVHHTNEIAQSEGATGKPLANIWLHGHFITVNGVKLSKSLGNSYTLHDISAHSYEPLALRLLFLQSHYRSEADFTWESLDAATNRLKSLRAMADLRWQTLTAKEPSNTTDLAKSKNEMLTALQDDLNTPQVLAILSNVEQQLATWLVTAEQKTAFIDFLQFVDDTLGLNLMGSSDIAGEQKALISKRETAREAKDFAKADHLRRELENQGVGLRDTAHGPVWHRL